MGTIVVFHKQVCVICEILILLFSKISYKYIKK